MNPYSSQTISPPSVTFLGAARSVTGSMHLVESGPHRLLLDCGLTRGAGDDRLRNRRFPFAPQSIDAVVLSHAHTDHCGNLPNLVRQGFHGPIYCTPPTRDLLAVMLADSARIQEDDARVAGVARGRAVLVEHGPLYTRQDVTQTIEQAIAVDYDTPVAINPDAQLRFTDAGHILGSAIVSLTLLHAGREHRLTFTGDLGRRGLPYLRDPARVPAADLVICESTYGGRSHDTLEGMAARMADVVRRTVARGGKVLIPAFSLGRTQVVVHYLRHWMAAGALPRLPIYVDSPLAAEIGMVYEEYADHLQEPEAEPVPVEFILDADEARRITSRPDPCVIVASGGMCDGGRILHHLKHHVDDPRSTVVLVSYQAPHSVGARLLEARPTVRFHGRTWNKWVEVTELNGFSGHADQDDFEALLGPACGATGRVRLVHGEPEQSEALARRLRRLGFADVDVPEREAVVKVA
jgi:metallo-beta-lactamase family protein